MTWVPSGYDGVSLTCLVACILMFGAALFFSIRGGLESSDFDIIAAFCLATLGFVTAAILNTREAWLTPDFPRFAVNGGVFWVVSAAVSYALLWVADKLLTKLQETWSPITLAAPIVACFCGLLWVVFIVFAHLTLIALIVWLTII